jgi:alpha-galactosidase
VLFAFLHSGTKALPDPAIQLRGLDPVKRYRVSRLGGGDLPAGVPAEASGAYWMQRGVPVALRGDFQAAGFVFEAR